MTNLVYNTNYVNNFHSPGIESWVAGFLNSTSPKSIIDIGCGLGFTGVLLKLHMDYSGYLVGLDIVPEKIRKTKKLSLYDDLVIGDATKPPFKPEAFECLISLEVLHQLPGEALIANQKIIQKNGSIILTLPNLPQGTTVKDIIRFGYDPYKFLLRGLILINLRTNKVLIVRHSAFYKLLRSVFQISIPILRAAGFFNNGYLLVCSS